MPTVRHPILAPNLPERTRQPRFVNCRPVWLYAASRRSGSKASQMERQHDNQTHRNKNHALADFPFQTFDKVRYADTDRQGHVNNAAFAG